MNNHYAYNEESPSCLINKKTGRHLGCVGNHGYYQVIDSKIWTQVSSQSYMGDY